MRIFSILFTLTFTLVQITNGRKFSDESKSSLVNRFRHKFQAYLNNEFWGRKETEIEKIHLDLLRLKNAECPKQLEKFSLLFQESKNNSIFNQILTKWSNLKNQSFEQDIVEDFNKIVKKKTIFYNYFILDI